MKALVFSDLHLTHCDLDYPLDFPAEAEVAIIAGDVWGPVSSSLKWLFENLVAKGLPVIFVAGNHEHYGHILSESISDGLVARGSFPGLHWLENETAIVGGIRYLGATLWTDYNLHGQPRQSMNVAMLGLNDHRIIYTVDAAGHRGRFYPEDHHRAARWNNHP